MLTTSLFFTILSVAAGSPFLVAEVQQRRLIRALNQRFGCV